MLLKCLVVLLFHAYIVYRQYTDPGDVLFELSRLSALLVIILIAWIIITSSEPS